MLGHERGIMLGADGCFLLQSSPGVGKDLTQGLQQ